MEEENRINESVLFYCHDMFRQFLDITRIIPFLGKYGLLTPSDREVLLQPPSHCKNESMKFIPNLV